MTELKTLSEPSDKDLLDWLQSQTKGYGLGWICRNSSTGRGIRLHETYVINAQRTVRGAIKAFMKEVLEEEDM